MPFGSVGSISKTLFGTLNEDDIDYINGQIDRLFADQMNLTHLIGEQMHITASKLQDLHDAHVIETKRVDELRNYVRNMHTEVVLFKRQAALLQYSSTLVNYAHRVETKIDRYIETCER